MEAERWQRIEQIYNEALACDAGRRKAFVDRSCASDESLRREVESLLNYSGRSEPVLEKPALELLAEELAGDLSRQPPPAEKMIGALAKINRPVLLIFRPVSAGAAAPEAQCRFKVPVAVDLSLF